MNELVNNGDKRMTTKEVADALGMSERSVREYAKALGITENGKTTYYTEEQATYIKKQFEKSGRSDLANVRQVANITTDYEMQQKTAEVMAWLARKIKESEEALKEEQRKNAVLMHVSKTYTATEIAKELGMKSAQELNQFLVDKHVQYKMNDTWVPYTQYADLGYFEIKQEVLDNGHVVYHRRITQDGRAFILGLEE